MKCNKETAPRWYALKAARPVALAAALEERGVEIYLPMETVRKPDGTVKKKPLIPKLLFINSAPEKAGELESESRAVEGDLHPFWIYRYRNSREIQPIGEAEFRLFRLLTAEDSMKCEIYRKNEFKVGDRLRVKSGPFAGYEGYARRIKKNKHIVVEIEGLCAIALPFIHPDLLEKI
ncbi:hypothetical protein HDR70_04070 [bacterium]|nr:hypothetical protein [bacterium]